MDALLHIEQELGVGGLGPEVLHDVHRLQEVGRKRRALRKARIVQHCLVAGITAERPPFLLDIRLRKPFDIGERIVPVRRVGDHRDALPAELGVVILLLRIDEEADLVAADIGILVEAGEECEEVHLHCDLSGLEGIEPFGHVGVAHAGRGAALVQRLVEFECLDRFRRVDEALHLIGLVRIVVLEAPVVERVRHAHGDAF